MLRGAVNGAQEWRKSWHVPEMEMSVAIFLLVGLENIGWQCSDLLEGGVFKIKAVQDAGLDWYKYASVPCSISIPFRLLLAIFCAA